MRPRRGKQRERRVRYGGKQGRIRQELWFTYIKLRWLSILSSVSCLQNV